MTMDNDSPMFGGTPIWERNSRKRRGFGGSTARSEPTRVEPAYGASATTLAATADPLTGAGATMDPLMDPLMTPGRATTTEVVRTRNGSAGPAIAVGAAALVAVGVAGWYVTSHNNHGVAELTPGVATATTVAEAPVAPALTAPAATPTPAAPTVTAAATPPAAPRASHATVRVARAHPAARSATASGMNASATTRTDATATLPAAPQPYSGSTAVNPVTPAPQAVTPAPEPVPSTPPVAATPAPSDGGTQENSPTPAP